MMPETGRQATKKMVYLFVYISTLILNAAPHTPESTHTHSPKPVVFPHFSMHVLF